MQSHPIRQHLLTFKENEKGVKRLKWNGEKQPCSFSPKQEKKIEIKRGNKK